jgi:dTDP-4-dehydrorhamnose 3,5-epimerase
VRARELAIPGLWEFIPDRHSDDRGDFLVWYDAAVFAAALGFEMPIGQSNHSRSRRGVIRGVHWADVPPGQAKYVYCPQGRILEIAVDLRIGSPTYGRHLAHRLDGREPRALYLAEGIGHAFCALADDSVLTYLCSTRYAPDREHTLNPMDPELGLPWPDDLPVILSDRDRVAPSLAEVAAAGLLPRWMEDAR